MRIGGVLADASALYRLLLRRSLVAAAAVYLVVLVVQLLAERPPSPEANVVFELAYFVLSLAGPLLVQGALIELVNDVHEGRSPSKVPSLFGRTWSRLLSLVGGSLAYALATVVGLLLLIVPGLYVLARWSLIVPSIMLENATAGEAIDSSSRLVRGSTGRVLVVVLVVGVLDSVPLVVYLALWEQGGWLASLVVSYATSVLIAPYSAHVLSVLYYRLADPDRPLLHPPLAARSSIFAPT